MANDNTPSPTYLESAARDPKSLLHAAAQEDIDQVILFAHTKDGRLHISYSEAPMPVIWTLAEMGHRALWDTLLAGMMEVVPPSPPPPPAPHKPLDG